tara:strand:- start:166 stop:360 length:195 start_codon:yes stop_codon:yes gene_type:complete
MMFLPASEDSADDALSKNRSSDFCCVSPADPGYLSLHSLEDSLGLMRHAWARSYCSAAIERSDY